MMRLIIKHFHKLKKKINQLLSSKIENIFQSRAAINVTSPALPPLREVLPLLKIIWMSKKVTNMGVFHKEFESQLQKYLGAPHISLFSSGTSALITTLKSLELEGEVITTPFSFIATINAIVWAGFKPVFVDIDKKSLNINPELIEQRINHRTVAIVAVHCYGNPCDINSLIAICNKYKLKLIFDGAQAFDSKLNGKNIVNYGDMSILSFHATKVFTTFEGGAIICQTLNQKRKLDKLKNFGFNSQDDIDLIGLNFKMNEFCCLLGIIQLKYIKKYLKKRKLLAEVYRQKLINSTGISLIEIESNHDINNSYFPILIEKDYLLSRDELISKLQIRGINLRKYFFPLLSNLKMYNHLDSSDLSNLPVANDIANKVVCLPIYPDLKLKELKKIAHYINNPDEI